MKNIVIYGFMGAGKTTLGKFLSEKTGKEFYDTDLLLTEKYGMPVGKIFSEYGEEEFRKSETEIFIRLMSKENAVISVGGGFPLREENRLLMKNCICVYLDADADTVFSRLKEDDTRPLLTGKNKKEKIISLLLERENVYKTVGGLTLSALDTPDFNVEKIIEFCKIRGVI